MKKLRKNYEKTKEKLRKNYGCTTMIYRSADYRSLQVTTGHYGHYRHYRFREKVTGFADGVWEFITKYIQMAFNGSLLLFPETIRCDSRGASGMIQLNNNLK